MRLKITNYFAHVRQSITILQIERVLQTMRSGAKSMQDKQLVEENISKLITTDWYKFRL